MVKVLRRLDGTSILEDYPSLSVYIARDEWWLAWKRTFDAR